MHRVWLRWGVLQSLQSAHKKSGPADAGPPFQLEGKRRSLAAVATGSLAVGAEVAEQVEEVGRTDVAVEVDVATGQHSDFAMRPE